jgi:hypothetical protein
VDDGVLRGACKSYYKSKEVLMMLDNYSFQFAVYRRRQTEKNGCPTSSYPVLECHAWIKQILLEILS